MTDQSDFETVLVRDSRLNDISDSIVYPVAKGASKNTYQVFSVNSNTPSNISFTVNPPSESVAIARDVRWRSTVNFTLTIGTAAVPANLPALTNVLQYGQREAFQAFPLNQLVNNSTISINNVSVNNNQQDTMQALLRMLDEQDLQKYSQGTPTYLDKYARYQDAVATFNNPLGSYSSSGFNSFLQPRGTHPLTIVLIERYAAGALQDNSPVSGGVNNHWLINLRATFTEPLFCSPFAFSHDKNNQSAFLGINNFLVNLSLDTTGSRFWSSGLVLGAGVPYNVTITGFTQPELLLNFLTLDNTFLVPSKVVLPFTDYPRYITSNNLAVINAGARATYDINSLQLNYIPERIMVYVRKLSNTKTALDTMSQLVIESCRVTFNNSSGILSNAQQQDLYKTSIDNGLKGLNWYEWTGSANAYNALGTPATTYGLCGSLLILDPARDFELDPYLAPNSIGQFNLQMSLTCFNQTGANIAPEIVVVCQNSGFITTVSGNSTVSMGLLNMQRVMSAVDGSDKAYSMTDYKRMIGGSLAGVMNDSLKYLPFKRRGGARSGGSMIGGARSGGAKGMSSRLSSLVM